MPSALLGLFVVAFVAIGLLWVVKPRAMTRHHLRMRYGVTGDVEMSDTAIRLRQILAIVVLVIGVGTMFSWMGPL